MLNFIEAREDKHEHVQAIMNFRFSKGRILSKQVRKEPIEQVKMLEYSFREYDKLRRFLDYVIAEHGKENWSESQREQDRMCREMCELLPIKISKLNLELKRHQ